MPALSTASTGSCPGQQTAGGSKTVTAPLPPFLHQSHRDGAAARHAGQGVWASGCAWVCTISLGAVTAARPPPTPLAPP